MRNLFSPSATGNVTQVTVSAQNFNGALAPHGSLEIRTADNYPSDSSTLISTSTSAAVGPTGYTEIYTMSPGTITAGTQYELIVRANDPSLNFIVSSGGSGLSGYMYTGNNANGVGTYNSMGGGGIVGSVTIGPLPLSASVSVNPAAPDGLANWYTTAPTVTVTCAGGDPATDCPAPSVVADGLHTPIIGVVHNAGGESAIYTGPGMQVDTVAPTATATLTGTAGSNGWYTSAVGVSWHCTDATSGVAELPRRRHRHGPGHHGHRLGDGRRRQQLAGLGAREVRHHPADDLWPRDDHSWCGRSVRLRGDRALVLCRRRQRCGELPRRHGRHGARLRHRRHGHCLGRGRQLCLGHAQWTGSPPGRRATRHRRHSDDAPGQRDAVRTARAPPEVPVGQGGPRRRQDLPPGRHHGVGPGLRGGSAPLAARSQVECGWHGGQAGRDLRHVPRHGCRRVLVHVRGDEVDDGSFRKFGLLAPDGTVTYKTVYIR